ncbi:MAG: ArnT family glycosyltransferase [Sphingomonadales bacterium]|jgi:4-amino-4-deoxy-L-arabinose transferase-like glycosyltransferase
MRATWHLFRTKRHTIAGLLAVAGIWFFLYINSLSVPIIQQWDEARNAVNTQEMLQNGKWLVRHFQGKPETWELKPPLLIWTQCLSSKIWGVSEFGIRFPSALAALGIAIITFFFLIGEGVKPITAAVSAVMTITIPATLQPHGFLFGDHDAMLCFFQVVMLVCEYRFLKSGNATWAWGSALGFLLGWYTKSIASCFVLPGMMILGLLDREYRKNLFSMRQLLPFGIAAFCISAYYMIREHIQPGYIAMVNQEEWMGRFAAHPDANRDLFYYLKGFYHDRLQGFFYPAVAAIIWATYRWKRKSFSQIGLITILITLPLISISQSKNFWYDLPLMFPLVICLAQCLNDIFIFCESKLKVIPIILGLILLIFMVKEADRLVQSHNHKNNPDKKEILVTYLKNNTFSASEKYGIYCNAFNTDILFYLNNMAINGYTFKLVEPKDSLIDFSSVYMAREDWDEWHKQRDILKSDPRFLIIDR